MEGQIELMMPNMKTYYPHTNVWQGIKVQINSLLSEVIEDI